jgi:hypothetical protein
MQAFAKVALGLSIIFFLSGFNDPITAEVKSILARLDYIAIEPSSNSYTPGSFVYRKDYDPAVAAITSTKLGFLCTPEFSSAKIDDAAIRTPLSGGLIGLLGGDSVSLDTQFIQKYLSMSYTSRYADSVVVRILDQATVEYSDQKLSVIRERLGPECTKSVNSGVSNKNAYQIAGVYELRLQFEVRYRDDLTDKIKRNIRAEVGRLGAPLNLDNAAIVKGQTSVYGITWKKLW